MNTFTQLLKSGSRSPREALAGPRRSVSDTSAREARYAAREKSRMVVRGVYSSGQTRGGVRIARFCEGGGRESGREGASERGSEGIREASGSDDNRSLACWSADGWMAGWLDGWQGMEIAAE